MDGIQYSTLPQQRAAEHAPVEHESQSSPRNLNSLRIENIPPDLVAHQKLISTTDHIMQLIGNPVRTLLALSENISCATDSSIETLHVLCPNELTINCRHLLETRALCRSMKTRLLHYRNQTTPQYQACLENFNRAEDALNEALQLLQNNNTRWSVYCNAMQSAASSFTSFATSVQNLHATQSAFAASSPPGAYHISAAEATREGIFFDHEPRPPQEPLEAIPMSLPIAHLQPFPEKESDLRLLRKAPYRPNGLPIVQAEAPIMMVHGIPTAEAMLVPQENSENHSTPKN